MPSLSQRSRLRFYSLGVLAGLAIGFCVLMATSVGLETITGGRIGGDLPAFYGAGRIVRSGNVASLYDPVAQRTAQQGLLPHTPDGWIHFAYPPPVALAYAPLTFVSFKAAYVVHTALMVGCCILATWLLRQSLAGFESVFWTIVAIVLTFYPLFRAVAGGQNAALSILCAAGAINALRHERDVVAGLWLGAWLFKPQLAIPVILATGISRPRVLTGAAAVGILYYVAGASIAGVTWPVWWVHSASAFAVADRMVDAGNGISFVEIASGRGFTTAGWIAAAVMLIVVLKAARVEQNPASIVALSSAAAPLVAPHALYYDAALALIALTVPGETLGKRVLPWLAMVWVLGAGQWAGSSFFVPPASVALLVAFIACDLQLRTRPEQQEQPSRSAPQTLS